ncbi:hypothetical protein CEP52_003655 [Fusarium oligoseptatum]|uniref:Uncharacterized protein n=1 Tax=Fusarium oligoseptatum TaxID=2604345 RepID=A0A428U7V8_9HYPO|nr:hypothetical protein CEP52_003655 [Fusarium oligoseptatum]
MRCIFSTERDPPTYEYSQLPVLNLAATAAEKISSFVLAVDAGPCQGFLFWATRWANLFWGPSAAWGAIHGQLLRAFQGWPGGSHLHCDPAQHYDDDTFSSPVCAC